MGVLDEYLFTFHLQGHALERGTDAGPPETLPGCRLEGRTVIGAYEVAPVDGKKLVLHPIQRNADVGAAIHVSIKVSPVVQEHRFKARLAIVQGELLAPAGRELRNFADELSVGLSLGLVRQHLSPPRARDFLRGNRPARRPGQYKPADDRENPLYTDQRYKVRCHARRARRACSTSDTARPR